MKRLLSIFLVLTLCLGLCCGFSSAVFAEGEEPAAEPAPAAAPEPAPAPAPAAEPESDPTPASEPEAEVEADPDAEASPAPASVQEVPGDEDETAPEEIPESEAASETTASASVPHSAKAGESGSVSRSSDNENAFDTKDDSSDASEIHAPAASPSLLFDLEDVAEELKSHVEPFAHAIGLFEALDGDGSMFLRAGCGGRKTFPEADGASDFKAFRLYKGEVTEVTDLFTLDGGVVQFKEDTNIELIRDAEKGIVQDVHYAIGWNDPAPAEAELSVDGEGEPAAEPGESNTGSEAGGGSSESGDTSVTKPEQSASGEPAVAAIVPIGENSLTDALKAIPELDTPEKIEAALESSDDVKDADGIVVIDLTTLYVATEDGEYADGSGNPLEEGQSPIEMTKEQYEKGVTALIRFQDIKDMPELVVQNYDKYAFVILFMYDEDVLDENGEVTHEAGEIEVLKVVKTTEDGIWVNLSSDSILAISWTASPEPPDDSESSQSGKSSGGPGGASRGPGGASRGPGSRGSGEAQSNVKTSSKELAMGVVTIYDFGDIKIHAYDASNEMDEAAYVIESGSALVGVSMPASDEPYDAWNEYIDTLRKPMDDLFLTGTPLNAEDLEKTERPASGEPSEDAEPKDEAKDEEKELIRLYSTKSVSEYFQSDEAAEALAKIAEEMGEHYRLGDELAEASEILKPDPDKTIEIGGVEFRIVENGDSYDIVIPSVKVVFSTVPGKDSFGVYSDAEDFDDVIDSLKGYEKDEGIEYVFGSSGRVIEAKDLQTVIENSQALKVLAEESEDADAFIEAAAEAFPDYKGESALKITAGNLLP